MLPCPNNRVHNKLKHYKPKHPLFHSGHVSYSLHEHVNSMRHLKPKSMKTCTLLVDKPYPLTSDYEIRGLKIRSQFCQLGVRNREDVLGRLLDEGKTTLCNPFPPLHRLCCYHNVPIVPLFVNPSLYPLSQNSEAGELTELLTCFIRF